MRSPKSLPIRSLPPEGGIGYTPVQGTWSWENDPRSMVRTAVQNTVRSSWWKRGSAHNLEMNRCGLYILDPEDPFAWDTGLPWTRQLVRWRAAGWYLAQWARLKQIPFLHANYLTYSNGIQAFLFALGYGLRVRNVVSVAPPLRDDVFREISGGGFKWEERFDRWTILTEAGLDITRELGQWFGGRHDDGYLGERVHVERVVGMGHGLILTDPNKIQWWKKRGWCHYLRHDYKEK